MGKPCAASPPPGRATVAPEGDVNSSPQAPVGPQVAVHAPQVRLQLLQPEVLVRDVAHEVLPGGAQIDRTAGW